MSEQTITKQIEILADSSAVFALIADAARVPTWAPGFADRMERSSDGQWAATKGARQFIIAVEASEESQTVDYLRKLATGRRGGAYIRVIDAPRAGCVVVMTIPVVQNSNIEEASAVLERNWRSLQS